MQIMQLRWRLRLLLVGRKRLVRLRRRLPDSKHSETRSQGCWPRTFGAGRRWALPLRTRCKSPCGVRPAIADCYRSTAHEAALHKRLLHRCTLDGSILAADSPERQSPPAASNFAAHALLSFEYCFSPFKERLDAFFYILTDHHWLQIREQSLLGCLLTFAYCDFGGFQTTSNTKRCGTGNLLGDFQSSVELFSGLDQLLYQTPLISLLCRPFIAGEKVPLGITPADFTLQAYGRAAAGEDATFDF